MRSSVVADVIIYSKREDLVKMASDHLKIKGVSNVTEPKDADDCIDSLNRFSKGLLIIDWALGAEDCVKVLGYNRKRFSGQLRPILLVADKVSEQIIATAAEYSVSQIFTEQLTIKNLGSRLASLIIGETIPNEIKKALNEVHEARLGGDVRTALTVLQKILVKHPTNLRLKCELAETLIKMNQWDNAYKVLEGVDKVKPTNLRATHLYGRCLLKMGRFKDALQTFEQCTLFNPHDVERLCDIGQALLNMDRIKDAGEHFDKALEIDPDMREAKMGKSQVELMDGHVNEALTIMKEISGDLEMASVFNTCAVLNMRQGRHEAGMNLYAAALKSLGKEARLQSRLFFNMGIGYRRWGKKEKALASFDEAQKLDPSFKKIQEQIQAVKASGPSKESAAPTMKKEEARDLVNQTMDGGLVDFNTDLASLLDEDLEETLFANKNAG